MAKVSLQLDSGDECALALVAINDPNIAECTDGLPNRHLTDAHARGNPLNGRQGLARLEFSGVDLVQEALLDLVVKRNAASTVQRRLQRFSIRVFQLY